MSERDPMNQELEDLRAENERLKHEIAHRDLAREIQREIWTKEVELSALRSQLANAWGKLR